MSFGMYSGWNPELLSPALFPRYTILSDEYTYGFDPQHHLVGVGRPSKSVLEEITAYFNQYLHLRTPWGLDWVWPSEGEYRPIPCKRTRAIDHFSCRL